jgi:hypothetical protein
LCQSLYIVGTFCQPRSCLNETLIDCPTVCFIYSLVDWSDKSFAVLLQTDHDFNLERQNLVHAGKQRVQEEYAQKAKDLEIQQRV